MPPICMPMEPTLAKPQRAKVAMEKVRGVEGGFDGLPSSLKARNSLMMVRVPRRLPMMLALAPGDADEPGYGGSDDAEDVR